MPASAAAASISLGPVLFHWDGSAWRDFYLRIADESDVDVVFVGETVCSKRLPFLEPHLPGVVERLQSAGKQVILSSQALVTLDRERRSTNELAQQDEFLVEGNDLSALHALAGRPHAVGPLVNVYNGPTARFLAGRGAVSICLPPELTASSVLNIASAAPGPVYEVHAFGRVPLAISPRCAHARAKGNAKDNCQFVCGQDPDGLAVRTLAGQSFLVMNGVQTMSYSSQVLLAEMEPLQRGGVSRFRLSPHTTDMVAVARIYRSVLEATMDPNEASTRLRELPPDLPLSNGFIHGSAGYEWIEDGRSRIACG